VKCLGLIGPSVRYLSLRPEDATIRVRKTYHSALLSPWLDHFTQEGGISTNLRASTTLCSILP
jgi:hypothetical protein